jgi:TonB-dependent receptor
MQKSLFTKTPLATGIALALSAAIVAPVSAQEEVIEEVVVTGIRGSLLQSAQIKRNSQGVVDAISAEDIGKFPDTNLAESLQRITGVSIDRARGEGQKVTVRGFGPQFNLVTLNGRQMPTHGGGAGSQQNRSFDFADLASEAVSAVEVYKTSRADLPTGGIGATINIKTTKPLESPGRVLSFGVKAVNDTSTEAGSNFTPEISGIYSDTFADDTFGIALTAIYQERDTGVDNANVRGWNALQGNGQCCDWSGASGPAVWSAIPNDANQINRPTSADEVYSFPQQLQYRHEEYARTRTNGQLTLQWDPTDTVRATLDYSYAKHELDRTFQDISAWFLTSQNAAIESEWTDGPVAGPIEYTEIYAAGADMPMGSGFDSVKNELTSVGFNLDWQATDRLIIVFDLHDSTSKATPNDPLGSSMTLAITDPDGRMRASSYYGSDLPILAMEHRNGGAASPDDMFIGGSAFTNDLNDMNITQAKIAGSFELNDIASIDFGVQTTDVDNRFASSTVQRDTWGGVGPAGGISDLLSPASMAGWFDEMSGSGDPRRWNQLFTWDTNALIERAREFAAMGINVDGSATFAGDCGDGFCASSNFTTDKRTQEEQVAIYAQLNLDLTWGDMPVNLDIGVRYEETEVASQALVPVIERIDWVTANEFPTITSLDSSGQTIQSFTSLTGKYDYVLPNLDFNIEVIDDLLIRASFSETIARPNYNDIQGGLTVGECRINGCQASSGDPALKPLESMNIDISVEWYYKEGSYASVGYFHKDVENFIGSRFVQNIELFPELTNPATGGLAATAQANGAQTADEIRAYIFANFPNDPTVNYDPANGIEVISGGVANEAATFTWTIPSNQQDAVIDGWEIALQHTFGDSGFGVIANATFVSGDISYDNLGGPIFEPVGLPPSATDAQFALTGLSDSANFVGFYDKNGVELRVAYNWRDEFLTGIGHDSWGAQPRYIEEYGQWDMNASYSFNDNYQVFVEAINVTDETFREHGRSELDLLNATQVGARYTIGFRAKFQ